MNVSSLLKPVACVASGLEEKPEFDTTEWFHSAGNSIYLKYLPLDVSKEDLSAAFGFAGKISRIDIVNSPPNKHTGATYRMVFIHYDFWYSTQISMEFRSQIISAYPKPYHMYSYVVNRELSVTINTRPVPKTNYNVDQLSDMFHRLQEQFTTTIEQQTIKIEEQSKEIADLKGEVARLTDISKNNSYDIFSVQTDIREQVYQYLNLAGEITLQDTKIEEVRAKVVENIGSIDRLIEWSDDAISETNRQRDCIEEIKESIADFNGTIEKTQMDLSEAFDILDIHHEDIYAQYFQEEKEQEEDDEEEENHSTDVILYDSDSNASDI